MTEYTHPAKNYTEHLKDTFTTKPVEQSPVASTTTDGTTYRLYQILDATPSTEYGMYVYTTESEGSSSESIYHHGKIDANGSFNTLSVKNYVPEDSKSFYEENSTHNNLQGDMQNHAKKPFRAVFGDGGPITDTEPSDVILKGTYMFIPSEAPRSPSSQGTRHINELAWEAYQEYLQDTFDCLPNGFTGVCVNLQFDDWRETADDLAYKSNLSPQQSVAWAIAQQGFNGSQIASLLDKDDSTVSRQLSDAAEKFCRSDALVGMTSSSPHNLQEYIHEAKMKMEREIAERDFERSKSPVTEPLRCPECGRDAGEIDGDGRGFEMVPGREFIQGKKSYPQHGGELVIVCPDCDKESSKSVFRSEWEDEHGKIPEPPHPDPSPKTRREPDVNFRR